MTNPLAAKPPPKRTRRTRAELRAMMLSAGKNVLFEIEPTLGFEQLTYTAVFEHLHEHQGQKVTIGSVHERIWPSQRDFQLDVIAQALQGAIPTVHDAAFTRAAELITSLDLSTPEARRYAIQSSIRHGSYHLNPHAVTAETDFAATVRFRLWALGPDNPEAVGFAETIAAIRAASTYEYTQMIRLLMQLIGLRVRTNAGDPDEVIESVAILGNATMLGLTTDVLPQSQRARLIPSGPNQELEEWHPDAIALWSNIRAMFELDGDGLTNDERRL